MSQRVQFVLALVLLGLGWGSTQPLGKLATSTGHPPFGLIFWQTVVCVVVLGAITLARGKGLPLHRQAVVFYVVVALLGTVIPNATFYISVARLPSGIMSILISMIPLMAFPLALMLGLDRFSMARLAGLVLGLCGVALIALPEASLPDPAMVAFLPLAILGPLFYALEGTFVQKFGTAGMDAIQAMFGASVVALILVTPVMLGLGQWISPAPPWGIAEGSLVLSSAMHGLLYAGYVALAARAGAVFASQCSYLVTGSGVVWAMILLGERFSPFVWAAMAVMLIGLALVQPRVARAAVAS